MSSINTRYSSASSNIQVPSSLLRPTCTGTPRGCTAALQALQDKYSQARQLVQCKIGRILNSPAIKIGDAEAFDTFFLSIQSLVGMLRTLEGQSGYELCCGSHVDLMLSKMPPTYRDGFIEHCLNHGILQTGTDQTYTLPDLAEWVNMKAQAKHLASRATAHYQGDVPKPVMKDQCAPRSQEKVTSIFLNTYVEASTEEPAQPVSSFKPKPYWPHCNKQDLVLNSL